jgi:hypothetical protein
MLSCSVYSWHRERACARYTKKQRIAASCMAINVWAVACVIAFYCARTAMWIAGWWLVMPVYNLHIRKTLISYKGS